MRLLEQGANPNLTATQTALLAAMEAGWPHVADLLLHHGADPNMSNINGWTPLMQAVAHEDFEFTVRLLDMGADPDAEDADGYTARMLTEDSGNRELMNVIAEFDRRGRPTTPQRDDRGEPERQPAAASAQPEPSRATASAAAAAPAVAEPKIEIGEATFGSVFPVLFKYYDENSIGSVTVTNSGTVDVEDLTVSLFIRNYMDNPKYSATVEELAASDSTDVELLALFNEEVLTISEGTRVSALIEVKYTANGEQGSDQSIDINHRNAMTWDDDRKACAFVTAKDPGVLAFAKSVAGAISGIGSESINNNLKLAMGIHEALAIHGMSYVVDPSTPYIEYSQNETAVDFLQFPVQSLSFGAGDCDDLSLLYSALLEAVGIETALITVPEHLLMAYSLGISDTQAADEFLKPDSLIFRDGEAWMPVETTETDDGFLNA